MNRVFGFVFVVLVIVVCGCGPNVTLKGTAVFSDDKSPVPSGTVCFSTPTFFARGAIKNGVFEMGSLGAADGLPPGKYQVYFTDVVTETGKDTSGEPSYTSLIDAKYNSAATSGLEQEVTASTKSITFELDRAKKSR
ncbi:MAG: hypothetical protein ACRC46_11130 [Thermoguttaceae bacterium]